MLELVCNTPSKYKKRLWLFQLSIFICILVIGLQYVLEVISGQVFLQNANALLDISSQISYVRSSMRNIKSHIQMAHLSEDMLEGVNRQLEGSIPQKSAELGSIRDTLNLTV